MTTKNSFRTHGISIDFQQFPKMIKFTAGSKIKGKPNKTKQ